MTAPTKVTASNWYWNKTTQIPALPVTPPVPVPALPLPDIPIPDGVLVPKGDLAVSFRGEPSGEPDRETYLSFDLGGAAPGSIVQSFTFTIAVDKANLTNAKAADIPLIACFPSRTWDTGVGGALYSEKPNDICADAHE